MELDGAQDSPVQRTTRSRFPMDSMRPFREYHQCRRRPHSRRFDPVRCIAQRWTLGRLHWADTAAMSGMPPCNRPIGEAPRRPPGVPATATVPIRRARPTSRRETATPVATTPMEARVLRCDSSGGAPPGGKERPMRNDEPDRTDSPDGGHAGQPHLASARGRALNETQTRGLSP
jgi:hypothetical protein